MLLQTDVILVFSLWECALFCFYIVVKVIAYILVK